MANVSIRMDDNLKKQAEDLFNDLGMNLTTAFTIFENRQSENREYRLRLPEKYQTVKQYQQLMKCSR